MSLEETQSAIDVLKAKGFALYNKCTVTGELSSVSAIDTKTYLANPEGCLFLKCVCFQCDKCGEKLNDDDNKRLTESLVYAARKAFTEHRT